MKAYVYHFNIEYYVVRTEYDEELNPYDYKENKSKPFTIKLDYLIKQEELNDKDSSRKIYFTNLHSVVQIEFDNIINITIGGVDTYHLTISNILIDDTIRFVKQIKHIIDSCLNYNVAANDLLVLFSSLKMDYESFIEEYYLATLNIQPTKQLKLNYIKAVYNEFLIRMGIDYITKWDALIRTYNHVIEPNNENIQELKEGLKAHLWEMSYPTRSVFSKLMINMIVYHVAQTSSRPKSKECTELKKFLIEYRKDIVFIEKFFALEEDIVAPEQEEFQRCEDNLRKNEIIRLLCKKGFENKVFNLLSSIDK